MIIEILKKLKKRKKPIKIKIKISTINKKKVSTTIRADSDSVVTVLNCTEILSLPWDKKFLWKKLFIIFLWTWILIFCLIKFPKYTIKSDTKNFITYTIPINKIIIRNIYSSP